MLFSVSYFKILYSPSEDLDQVIGITHVWESFPVKFYLMWAKSHQGKEEISNGNYSKVIVCLGIT